MVLEAAERIRPLARRTPVLTSADIDERAGQSVHLKCENLQAIGAFKIRGASNLILSLSKEKAAEGVVAFSSGNHAQAVALAAKYAGAPAVIVMPEDAPQSKVASTRALGARIVTYNRFTEDREAIAARLLGESGGTLVPPYDHPMIMAGQGTAARSNCSRIFRTSMPSLVPVSGGGLARRHRDDRQSDQSRDSLHLRRGTPKCANDTALSFAAGMSAWPSITARYHSRRSARSHRPANLRSRLYRRHRLRRKRFCW